MASRDDPDMENEMVALAWRHVIQGRAIVERQKLRVRALADAGHSTENAERMLSLFESTLEIFEKHLQDLTEGTDHTG